MDNRLVAQICSRGCAFGLSDEVSHTDECERELQVEEEVEQERELEIAQYLPARVAVLKAHSVQDVQAAVHVLDMKNYLLSLASSKELATLNWPAAQIFMTENFASTILSRTRTTSVAEFMRVVDALLAFNNRQVLLVSECEADHTLGLVWPRTTPFSFRFVNLAFCSRKHQTRWSSSEAS